LALTQEIISRLGHHLGLFGLALERADQASLLGLQFDQGLLHPIKIQSERLALLFGNSQLLLSTVTIRLDLIQLLGKGGFFLSENFSYAGKIGTSP